MWGTISILFFIFVGANAVKSYPNKIRPDVDYSCPLIWVAEGYGNVPLKALAPSPGEFVARVNLLEENIWRAARLIPDEGRADVVWLNENGEHEVFPSQTYEVLTNPHNCVTEWIPQFGGEVPRYAIPSDESLDNPNEFLGRGMVAGSAMVGSVLIGESAILIPYEGKVYERRHYDVITSRYPFLTMEILDFRFPILDHRILESNTRPLLIGQLEVSSDLTSNGDKNINLVHPIQHSQEIKELFIWQEEKGWEGVANLTIEMGLWFGAPPVLAEFKSIHKIENRKKKIFQERKRKIIVSSTLTISSKELLKMKSFEDEDEEHDYFSTHQICTSAKVLSDLPLKYEGLAKVTAPLMTTGQIREILRRTGRNILADYEEDEEEGGEEFVIAKVKGILLGSYVTGTTSHISPVDSEGPCTSVISKSKHSYFHHHHFHYHGHHYHHH